jgi:apolipoprotein D and lipocalin family protein
MHAATIAWIVFVSLVVFILLLWGITALVTWNNAKKVSKDQKAVAVDVEEYQGKWYEIARYEQKFQKGCSDVTANYFVHGNRLRVLNTCVKPDGSAKTASGWAYPTKNDGVFAVSFFPGIYGNYTVVKREHDISIVSNRSKSSLWVLARVPKLEESKRLAVWQWLSDNKYDVDKLIEN